MSTFSECDPASGDEPIGQGDIIRFVDPIGPWDQFGAIVTADCDIARNKHAGRLTFVPILTARSYLAEFWMPRRLEALAGRLGEQLVAQIRMLQAVNLPEFTSPLSSERALSWITERGPDAVGETLGVTDEPRRQTFLDLGRAYVMTVAALNASFDKQYEALANAYIITRVAKDRAAAADRIRNEVENTLATLPGDAMFLRCLGPDHNHGYVCYLRVLRDITDDEIAIRPREAALGRRSQRVARLRAPYRYRLTQQLADVFAAIGLPDEYEASRKDYAEVLLAAEQAETPGTL